MQRSQKLISKWIYQKQDQKCSWYKKWKLVFLIYKKCLKWMLATSMMTKSKVERMTCQNTCSCWIIYQKRCRIYLNVPIQWLKIKLKILLEAKIILTDVYQETIKDEVVKREISKLKLFNESKSKISLSKLSGYNSKLDVYTFQSEFIKIYKRTAPKRTMSDVLRNNHLEWSALSLVRSVDNIDEIWQRLKSAYGDPKLILKKKLSDLNKISPLSKLKDTERVVAALSQIINTMKDLQHLASEHHIESKLYSGDGLEHIYISCLVIIE